MHKMNRRDESCIQQVEHATTKNELGKHFVHTNDSAYSNVLADKNFKIKCVCAAGVYISKILRTLYKHENKKRNMSARTIIRPEGQKAKEQHIVDSSRNTSNTCGWAGSWQTKRGASCTCTVPCAQLVARKRRMPRHSKSKASASI